MDPFAYITIREPTEGLYKEKGSRFLSFAFPVSTVEEINHHIETLRKKYHDARHCCYAYRLGPEPLCERCHDDGEPANSAGKPILNQIKTVNLMNILVVVVRYFGGTLLGIGGLVQSYRKAAADAISHAIPIEKTKQTILLITCPYIQLNTTLSILRKIESSILEKNIDSLCRLRILLPYSKYQAICNELKMKIPSVTILTDQ